jgi:hypothetical protein
MQPHKDSSWEIIIVISPAPFSPFLCSLADSHQLEVEGKVAWIGLRRVREE